MPKNSTKLSQSKGFTLVELLVVVLVIGVLATIALPNFVSAQEKAKETSVKGNMHTAQIAAEAYAADNAGIYPEAQTVGYASYFPGGSDDGTASGNPLVNPFGYGSGFPNSGSTISSAASLAAARLAATTGIKGSGCGVEYDEITENGTIMGYAILGAKADGTTAVPNTSPNSTLILSNM